jgi:hypothetical protein
MLNFRQLIVVGGLWLCLVALAVSTYFSGKSDFEDFDDPIYTLAEYPEIDFDASRYQVNEAREEMLSLQELDCQRVAESKPGLCSFSEIDPDLLKDIPISDYCDYLWT